MISQTVTSVNHVELGILGHLTEGKAALFAFLRA